MLGRQGALRTLLVLALAATIALAGCVGDEGEDVSPASANQTDEAANDTATTTGLVDESRGTLAMTVGAGVPSGPWVYLGGGEVGLSVTGNVTSLTVHANLTDGGANATAPGAGFVGVELAQGEEVQESAAEPGATSYTFEVDEPSTGDWTVRLVPIGGDVNREVQVAMLAHGQVPVQDAG